MKKLLTFAVCALVAGLLQATQLDVSGFSKTVDITVSPSLGNFGADMPVLVRLSPATKMPGARVWQSSPATA